MAKEITKTVEDKNKLSDEQIENWRKVLSMTLGAYAFIMPKEDVQKMRDKMQGHVDNNL